MTKESMKKVLLADDVRLFLEVTKSFFNRENLQVTIAQGGREALKAARALRPDLLIISQAMRDLSGDECCRQLKADPVIGSTPVILIYEPKADVDEARMLASGCDHLLAKPVQRQQLLELARGCLTLTTRATPRQQTRILVRYGSGQTEQLHDYTVNLSVGGVFLETGQLVSPGTLMTLEFLVPGCEREVIAKTEVSWVNSPDAPLNPELPTGIGLKFLQLDGSAENAIRKFLHQERMADVP